MNNRHEQPDDTAGSASMQGRPAEMIDEPNGEDAREATPEKSHGGANGSARGRPRQSIVALLHTLAAQCRDSEAGYRQAYENADDRALRIEFGRMVDAREDMVRELDRCLRELGQAPPTSGTTLGAAHRIFLGLKAALRGRDRDAILHEIVRGESIFEATYDAILRLELPQSIVETIRDQHRQVRESRDRFKGQLSSGPEEEPPHHRRIGSVAEAIEKHPTAAVAVLAAAATGFAAALWATRHSGRRWG